MSIRRLTYLAVEGQDVETLNKIIRSTKSTGKGRNVDFAFFKDLGPLYLGKFNQDIRWS